MLRIESEQEGFEQPGSDLAHFLLRTELEDHIKLVHGGRKEYWRKVNSGKQIAILRQLDTLNKGISGSTSQKGSGENK
jgi:hypothetical protein